MYEPLFCYISVCSSLGSSFTRHEGLVVGGHNIWQGNVTLADCKQKCIDEVDNCLSFDYFEDNPDLTCRVNSISLEDARDAGYLAKWAGDDVYAKDCEH